MQLISISTTLRNPNRLIDFLRSLRQIDGLEWSPENQEKFQILLIKDRNYVPNKVGLTDESLKILLNPNMKMTYEQAKNIFEEKNYESPSMRGRTSISPLKEFGLAIVDVHGNIIITEQGKMLLDGEYVFDELFMRWSLKWQFPNPCSKKLKHNSNIRPFVAFIHLIDKVNTLCTELNLRPIGITKYEFSIFALSLNDFSNIDEVAGKIIRFRNRISDIDNKLNKADFFEEVLHQELQHYSNYSLNNVRDYSDNVIRYFLLTDLIITRGGGFYLDLNKRQKYMIDYVLSEFDGSSDNYQSEQAYLDYLCDYSKPEIPSEIDENITVIKKDVVSIANALGVVLLDDQIIDSKALKITRKRLLNLQYKEENTSIEGISTVIENLTNIRKLELKPSIALEFWVAKGLMLLNDAIEIMPNYLTDSDNNIIFTASGDKGDIECYYSDFNVLCEVTLLNGRNQWYNEGQPVMRHLKDFSDKHGIESYCLFIAPSIHRDTLNTFWTSSKYEYEGKKLKIVPISLQKFISILVKLKLLIQDNKRFSRKMLLNLFESVNNVSKISSSDEWSTHINNEFNCWMNMIE